MTMFRACTIKRGDIAICHCTDAEMQPCLSAVLERYLSDLAEFGPDDPWFRNFASDDLLLLALKCDSERELLFEITGDGSWLEGDDE